MHLRKTSKNSDKLKKIMQTCFDYL